MRCFFFKKKYHFDILFLTKPSIYLNYLNSREVMDNRYYEIEAIIICIFSNAAKI